MDFVHLRKQTPNLRLVHHFHRTSDEMLVYIGVRMRALALNSQYNMVPCRPPVHGLVQEWSSAIELTLRHSVPSSVRLRSARRVIMPIGYETTNNVGFSVALVAFGLTPSATSRLPRNPRLLVFNVRAPVSLD